MKCGLCEVLCISKVMLIFIYMKSKKKKIYGLYYIFCFYVVKNWYMNFWNVKNDIIFLIFISKLKKIFMLCYMYLVRRNLV